AAPFNLITCIGVLAHLTDPDAFLNRLAELRAGTFIIFTGRKRSTNRYSKAIANLATVSTFRERSTYTGVLSPAGFEDSKRPLQNIVCSNTPVLPYAGSRLALLSRRLRRGGNNGKAIRPPSAHNTHRKR